MIGKQMIVPCRFLLKHVMDSNLYGALYHTRKFKNKNKLIDLRSALFATMFNYSLTIWKIHLATLATAEQAAMAMTVLQLTSTTSLIKSLFS